MVYNFPPRLARLGAARGFSYLIYIMLKAVGGNDVGEFEGYVVLLQLTDVSGSQVGEDEELGVHVLENFGCLVCRKVYQLGDDEVEMCFERDLGEVMEIVGEVACEEHALAVVGFYHRIALLFVIVMPNAVCVHHDHLRCAGLQLY